MGCLGSESEAASKPTMTGNDRNSTHKIYDFGDDLWHWVYRITMNTVSKVEKNDGAACV
jgi:hypothetical protein